MFFEPVTYSAAFTAGLLSFFSPCILPLIPAYFSFITGFSVEELEVRTDATLRKKVLFSTAAYVLGFSLVFIFLGASASYAGGLMVRFQGAIRIIGGILVIIFGLHISGIVRLAFLDVEKRMHLNKKPLHFVGIMAVGMAFGAGWTPCIGPLLGSILIVAGSSQSVQEGMVLLGVYSAGLAIPFLILSVFINFILTFAKKAAKALKYINAAAGIFLIILGFLLLTNKLTWLVITG